MIRKILALLIVLSLFLPCAAGFTPAAAEGGADSSRPRAGAPEGRDDDDDDEDDDDDDKGGSSVNPNDLSFKGSLSGYQPKRENYSGLYWGTVFESGDDGDRHDGTPEYKATFSNGKLKELEVEIELGDGQEYEAVFNSKGKIIRAEYETDSGEIYYDGSSWRTPDGKKRRGRISASCPNTLRVTGFPATGTPTTRCAWSAFPCGTCILPSQISGISSFPSI